MSVDVHDIMTCATFCDDRLRGLGVAGGQISPFPIDLRRRPYNTVALPCECVMYRQCSRFFSRSQASVFLIVTVLASGQCRSLPVAVCAWSLSLNKAQ